MFGDFDVSHVDEVRLHGECAYCRASVVKVLNSRVPTERGDGVRFTYPDLPADDPWGAFRCRECRSVLDDTWRPLEGEMERLEALVNAARGVVA